MAGARFPSNAAAPDTAALGASNRRAAAYYATSAQSLYSDLWQDMRTYIDAYCSVTRSNQQHSAAAGRTSSSCITDFSSSPSNQSGLSYQQPYAFSRDLEGTVNFAQLENAGGGGGGGGGGVNARPISMDSNGSNTVPPTIQFDLGSNNPLSCSSQQANMNSFSSPYDYPSDARMESPQGNANQSVFSNDSSLSSQLWNMSNSFSCPSPSRKRKSVSEVPAEGYVTLADYHAQHQAEDMALESLYPSMKPKYVPEWRRC